MSGENVRTSALGFSPKNVGFYVRNHVRNVSGHVRRTRFDDIGAHRFRHPSLHNHTRVAGQAQPSKRIRSSAMSIRVHGRQYT